MVAAPVDPPLQAILVCDTTLDVIALGSVMITCCVLVQLLASVIVQVHVPAVNPLTEAVPSPVGLPGVQL